MVSISKSGWQWMNEDVFIIMFENSFLKKNILKVIKMIKVKVQNLNCG